MIQNNAFVRQAQVFDDLLEEDFDQPEGLLALPNGNLLTLESQPSGSIKSNAISTDRELIRSVDLPASIKPLNTAFDPQFERLLGLNPSGNKLIEIELGSDGRLNSDTLTEIDAKPFDIKNARGVTVAPDGTLYVLDGAAKEIVVIEPDDSGNFNVDTISKIDLPSSINNARGIALNPNTDNFQVLSPNQKTLYELNQNGELVATRDLSEFSLQDPQAIVFAPSGDSTDPEQQQSLYIADEQLGIVELSFVEPPDPEEVISSQSNANGSLTLVQTIDGSEFSPPSPDPSGIAYISSTNSFTITDGEIEEDIGLPFQGVNVWDITGSGSVVGTGDTTAFSDEPTGISFDPNFSSNGRFFISDDSGTFRGIYVIDPGNDGLPGGGDDNQLRFNGTNSFGRDPEGVTFADLASQNVLFIADGKNNEIYRTTLDGQLIGNFDTFGFGLTDPEGIAFDSQSGNLFLVSDPDTLFETSTDGTLLNVYDISAANAVKPAGVALGPSSNNPNSTSVYIADRAIDNNADPTANDGKIYEFLLRGGVSPSNQAPIVDAGEDQTINDFSVLLDAAVNDDGQPDPPGALSYTWSLVNGPGTVTFSDPNAEDTTVDFEDGVFGEYVLSLEASDSDLSTSDQVSVTVNETTEPPEFSTIYVSSSSNGTVDGISFSDEDILAFDTVAQTWSLYFDGSDVGLDISGADVDAFYINSDDSILLSLENTYTLPDVGSVDENDIVRFIPTSTGSNTAGTYELYFDGSDVDLTGSSEDIDGIAFTTDDRLIISTKGDVTVPGGTSGGGPRRQEDLLAFAFTPTSLGEETSGTWETFFDGSDVGLQGNQEDINGVWIDNTSEIYITTQGDFNVPGGVSGDSADIFIFDPISTGPSTSGAYSSFFDGSANGFGEDLDGIHLV